MKWTYRMSWAIAALGTAGLVAGATVMTSARPQDIDVVDVERNCWDRSTWGYPDPEPVEVPGCKEPDVPGCDIEPPKPDQPGGGEPYLRSHDLTPRPPQMTVGTLQVVTFYDGANTRDTALHIEITGPKTGTRWLSLTGIEPSTSDRGRICTFEYDLRDASPTGRFEIDGLVPNGVIDGLAFGLLWRDAAGFHVLRSTAPEPLSSAALVGTWPLFMSDTRFARRTPQLTTSGARGQARAAIYGAEYLQNGAYLITIQERSVAVRRRDVR